MELFPHPNGVLQEKNEKTIIYRTYSIGARTIEVMTTARIEKNSQTKLQGISFLARGKKIGTVEMRFREVAIARMRSATLLKTDGVVLLIVYIVGRTSRVWVE